MPVRGGRSRRHFELRPEGADALVRSRGMLDQMWEGVEVSLDADAHVG